MGVLTAPLPTITPTGGTKIIQTPIIHERYASLLTDYPNLYAASGLSDILLGKASWNPPVGYYGAYGQASNNNYGALGFRPVGDGTQYGVAGFAADENTSLRLENSGTGTLISGRHSGTSGDLINLLSKNSGGTTETRFKVDHDGWLTTDARAQIGRSAPDPGGDGLGVRGMLVTDARAKIGTGAPDPGADGLGVAADIKFNGRFLPARGKASQGSVNGPVTISAPSGKATLMAGSNRIYISNSFVKDSGVTVGDDSIILTTLEDWSTTNALYVKNIDVPVSGGGFTVNLSGTVPA